MRKYLFYLLLSMVPFFSGAQQLVFKEVTKLSPKVNSKFEESMPLLSPDGKTLYFTRILNPENTGGEFAGSDVWTSRWDVTTGSWSNPSNKEVGINSKANNTLVGMNKGGDILYVLNTWGIYFIKKSGGKWAKPEQINIPDFHADGFVGVFVAPDFDVIFISMKGPDSQGEEDLYVSLKDARGNWSRPRNLGTTINTTGFEISPFLSADKKRLFFSSNGHGGYGDADIFYSERLYNSWENWSVPKNLGDTINSSSFDAYLSSYDSIVFFCSNRTNQYADIYSAAVSGIIDTKQQQVNKIVAEANSILADIKSETPDSLNKTFESQFISFEYNAAEMNTKASRQLDRVLDVLKNQPGKKVSLVAYSTDFDSESLNTELSYKRAETIRDYFKTAGGTGVKVSIEVRKREKRAGGPKNGVEVRYERSVK